MTTEAELVRGIAEFIAARISKGTILYCSYDFDP